MAANLTQASAVLLPLNTSVDLLLKVPELEGIIRPCHLCVCCVDLRSNLQATQKENSAKLNCAVGQVREKLEKLSDFFSKPCFHFNFIQVALLAMDAVEHP